MPHKIDTLLDNTPYYTHFFASDKTAMLRQLAQYKAYFSTLPFDKILHACNNLIHKKSALTVKYCFNFTDKNSLLKHLDSFSTDEKHESIGIIENGYNICLPILQDLPKYQFSNPRCWYNENIDGKWINTRHNYRALMFSMIHDHIKEFTSDYAKEHTLQSLHLDSIALYGMLSKTKQLLNVNIPLGLLSSHLTIDELFDIIYDCSIEPDSVHQLSQYYISEFDTDDYNLSQKINCHLQKPYIPLNQCQNILMTGGTGFLGPYLIHEMMQETQANIHVIVRAESETQAKLRLIENLNIYHLTQHCDLDRLHAIPGELNKDNLSLDSSIQFT